MQKKRFDKFLSTLAIVAVAGCIVSLFQIVFYYFWGIAHLPGGEEYWTERFHTRATVFAFSLFLGLGCLVVHRLRKRTRKKTRKEHETI